MRFLCPNRRRTARTAYPSALLFLINSLSSLGGRALLADGAFSVEFSHIVFTHSCHSLLPLHLCPQQVLLRSVLLASQVQAGDPRARARRNMHVCFRVWAAHASRRGQVRLRGRTVAQLWWLRTASRQLEQSPRGGPGTRHSLKIVFSSLNNVTSFLAPWNSCVTR